VPFSQKLMRFELPFKIKIVEEVGFEITSYKVFIFRGKLFSEILSNNGVVKILPITSNNVSDIPGCMFQRWWLRGPNALYGIRSSRRGDALQLCWRNDCNACEIIKEVKVFNVYEDVDSLALVYRKNKEYYAIIDDISGFTMTRLSDSKPKQVLYNNGVLILFLDDYIRVVSPATGIVDVALTENVYPLGIDIAGNPSTILLHSKSSGIVFSLSRTRDLEPLASCNEVIGVRDTSGGVLVLCGFEPLNSSFYPFYAGKVFVDIFRETDNFNIINPYIFSFIRRNNKKYFVGALIEPHPVYISITRNSNAFTKKVLASINLKGVEESLLDSIESIYGPIIANNSDERLVASLYVALENNICLGASCGKCIVRISSLGGDIIDEHLVISLGDNTYEPSHVSGQNLLYVIEDAHSCRLLSESHSISVCDEDACIAAPITYHGVINAQLVCEPKALTDIDELQVVCRAQGDVEKIITYTPCPLVRISNDYFRVYIKEGKSCDIGLVTSDGFVIKERLTHSALGETITKKTQNLTSISFAGTYKDSLLVKFSYQGRGLIPLKINGVFNVIDAPYVILRLSGDNDVLIRDGEDTRRISLKLPYSGKAVIEPSREGVFRIRCIEAYCTLLCGDTVSTSSIIDFDLRDAQKGACHLVIMGRGAAKILRINPISEALRLGVLAGRRLAQIL